MLYFANPSTQPVRDAMTAGLLGMIVTPVQGNKLLPGVQWCADNGCFGSGYPGDAEWFGWLAARADQTDLCAFATVPDVVGDAAATLERSTPWFGKIRGLGYPVAFVAQDGMQDLAMPWSDLDVLFIGGSTAWKLGPDARGLIRAAKARDKRVHFGRVNSLRRLRYADAMGADSADGTYLIFGPDTNLPKLLAWLRRVERHPDLFDEGSS